MKHRYAVVLSAAISICFVGCEEQGGPSNSDVRDAMLKKIAEVTKADPIVSAVVKHSAPDLSQYEIKETKCTDSGNDTYDCVVTTAYQSRTESKHMTLARLKTGWAIAD